MFATVRHAALLVATATATIGTVGFASAPAHAAPFDEARSMQVRHADLDLASAQGVTTLERRVRTAVKTVCGTADSRDLDARARINVCRAGATASARPGVELAIANARDDVKLAQNDSAPSIGVNAH